MHHLPATKQSLLFILLSAAKIKIPFFSISYSARVSLSSDEIIIYLDLNLEEGEKNSVGIVYVIIKNFKIYIILSDKLFIVNDRCAIDRTID